MSVAGPLTIGAWLFLALVLVFVVKFFWVIVIAAIAYLLAEPITWLLSTNQERNDL